MFKGLWSEPSIEKKGFEKFWIALYVVYGLTQSHSAFRIAIIFFRLTKL